MNCLILLLCGRCHNWIVDGMRCLKGSSQQKWMSTGCTVKCDPETMLSNEAEWYCYFIIY